MAKDLQQEYQWRVNFKGISPRDYRAIEKILYDDKAIDSANAYENVKRNMVLLLGSFLNGRKEFSGTNASGVLLSRNGLLLTAYHCVEAYFDAKAGMIPIQIREKYEELPEKRGLKANMFILGPNNQKHPINLEFIVAEKRGDIALVKARIDNPRPYRSGIQLLARDVKPHSIVRLLGYPDMKFKEKKRKSHSSGWS